MLNKTQVSHFQATVGFTYCLNMLSPNLPYSTPLNPPHSSKMCHKSQFLSEVCSTGALLQNSTLTLITLVTLRKILNCFLCCLPSLMMSFSKQRTLSYVFCCFLTQLAQCQAHKRCLEAATEQPGLVPLKAGLLCSPLPGAPLFSQSISPTVAPKACTTCSPPGPSLASPPTPFSHSHSALATLFPIHIHQVHSCLRASALVLSSTCNSSPRQRSHLIFFKSFLIREHLTTSFNCKSFMFLSLFH